MSTKELGEAEQSTVFLSTDILAPSSCIRKEPNGAVPLSVEVHIPRQINSNLEHLAQD